MVNVWLDDVRRAPDGWVHVKTAAACVAALRAYDVGVASLDHDLGNPLKVGTGMDVMRWLLRRAQAGDAMPAEIRIHTANGRARVAMAGMLSRIGKEALRFRNGFEGIDP